VPRSRRHQRDTANRRTVRTDDGALLNVVLDGPDPSRARATVLLVHGWTLTHHTWDDAVTRLHDGHPDVALVRFDLREHGRSTSGRAGLPPSVRRLGDDVATVLRTLRPAGPVVLVGHSMGAMALLSWVGRHVDQMSSQAVGFVLIGTAARLGPMRSRTLPLAMRVVGRVPHRVRVPRLPGSVRRSRAWGPTADPALVRRSGRTDGWVRARSIGAWYGALVEHDEREALAHLRSRPVTVVVGEHDRLTPPVLSERLAEAVPGARLVRVDDAGHMLPVERPDVVADQVEHLLTTL
jgi:pimeloyl-ACP methyl ester carboxylesterase